jgi:hypothetical protein
MVAADFKYPHEVTGHSALLAPSAEQSASKVGALSTAASTASAPASRTDTPALLSWQPAGAVANPTSGAQRKSHRRQGDQRKQDNTKAGRFGIERQCLMNSRHWRAWPGL